MSSTVSRREELICLTIRIIQ